MTAYAPVTGGKLVNKTFLICLVLALIGFALIAKRFMFGIGSVANINNGFPWGIWVVFDVVIGTALACGGYAMALIVYIANKGKYHPLVRPALLASAFGYTLGGLAVFVDLGRPWNAYNLFIPGVANTGSVMFEVALCVATYILVLWIEFSPAMLEKWGMKDLKQTVEKWMFLLIGLGMLLPTMHQSSLGSLLIVFGNQIDPVWQAGLALPALFLISAIMMGFAIVVFEAALSAAGLKQPIEVNLLEGVAKAANVTVIIYLALRFGELAINGKLGLAFGGPKAFYFWLETIFYIVPLILLSSEQGRKQAKTLFVAAMFLMLAGAFYRLNAFLIAYDTGPGWTYFPAVQEILITVGLVAFEVVLYMIFIRAFPVLHAPSRA